MAEEARAVAERWDRTQLNGGVVDANAEMVGLALRVVGARHLRRGPGQGLQRARRGLPCAQPAHLSARDVAAALARVLADPGQRRAAGARRALYRVVDALIAQRVQAEADGGDLLSRLLGARDPDSGEAMDIQQVRDEALIFLLAGHETTCTAHHRVRAGIYAAIVGDGIGRSSGRPHH